MRRNLMIALGIAGLAGCGGDSGSGPDTTRNLTIQAGNNQTGTAGQALATAPSVKVANGSGAGVAGVTVTFAVTGGGGSLSGATQTTDGQGLATIGSWTLGTTPGPNAMTATIPGGSVTFAATGTAGTPAAIQKQAGDGQSATVRAAVTIKPAVRVVDQLGTPIVGATVNFTVTGGAGTVAGGTQQTDAAGVATVGAWTLGPTNGPNTLAASIQGSTLAPVVFTATGQEIVLQPSKDTTFTAGTVALTRLLIPAGRTVTVTGPVTINADSTVEIAGKLVGSCVGISLNGAKTVTITGSIDNSCAAPGDAPGDLLIVGREGYTITGTDSLVTSGAGRITNDPTLADSDFPIVPAPPSLDRFRSAQLAQSGCRVAGKAFVTKPVRAKVGANGKTGGNGAEARPWVLECRGADLDLGAGVRVFGQAGGHGGVGADLNGDPGTALGGNGGTGGLISIRAKDGLVIFSGAVSVTSGDGGDGGDARATGLASKSGQKAAGAKATGGNGAAPGFVRVHGAAGITGGSNLTIVLGSGGRGGDAEADGAVGLSGKAPAGSSREQDGGDAESIGGAGAGSAAKHFTITGNALGAPTLSGGDGRRGGHATTTAGNGSAAPNEEVPEGGTGGNFTAAGGVGGNSLATRLTGGLIGNGGDGGFARFVGGIGGDGWNGCGALVKPGGFGGLGGDGNGHDGAGGSGLVPGDAGNVFVETGGNGGKGGNGEPGGLGGVSGLDLITNTGSRTDVEPTFVTAKDGDPCAPISKLTVGPTQLQINHVVGETACPTPGTPLTYQNPGTVAVSFTTVVTGTSLFEVNSSTRNGTLAPGQERSVTNLFNCAQAKSATGDIAITHDVVAASANRPMGAWNALLAPQVIHIPVTVTVSVRAVKLNHAVGGFAAGTVIPLNEITGESRIAAHAPICGYEHVHEAIPGNGIRIQGGAPVLDPEPNGCGFGEVVLKVVPP